MAYIPNPQHRLGVDGGKPLAVRHAAVVARAMREIPPDDPERGVINGMVSEESIDLIHAAIARARERHAPAEPTPQLRAEWDALAALARSYDSARLEIKDCQKHLWRSEKDWRHQLLRDLRADMYTVPPEVKIDWEDVQYNTVYGTRAAAKELFAKLQWINGLVTLINTALAFDCAEPADQALSLCQALHNENRTLKARVAALEAAVQAHFNQRVRRKQKSAA